MKFKLIYLKLSFSFLDSGSGLGSGTELVRVPDPLPETAQSEGISTIETFSDQHFIRHAYNDVFKNT